MIRFDSDYLEGAHPKVLKKIVDSNYEQTMGYGKDKYCDSAKEKIKKALGRDDVDIHFLVGGTQTNMTVISSILKSHEAVICADTAHVFVNETGAIESYGNRIITIPNQEGKITSSAIEYVILSHENSFIPEFSPKPKMVYITIPTECGTSYTKGEIEDIYNVCKKYDMYLYIDGARMAYGVNVKDSDITFTDIPNMCDAFYIGGTKCGALFGEAVVFVNEELKKDFRYHIKQHGALLAKGRLLGMQFDTLFTKDLYFRLGKQANEFALKIKNAAVEKGYPLLYNSFTNQQFIIFPNDKLEELEKKFTFWHWEKLSKDHTAVRICTSWATTEENVEKLINSL